jgi:hypothetical protein
LGVTTIKNFDNIIIKPTSSQHSQVLSAAHCFGNVNDFVTLGMHKIRLNADEAAEYNNIEHIPIAEWVKHPQFIPRGAGMPPLNYDFLMI